MIGRGSGQGSDGNMGLVKSNKEEFNSHDEERWENGKGDWLMEGEVQGQGKRTNSGGAISTSSSCFLSRCFGRFFLEWSEGPLGPRSFDNALRGIDKA